MTSARNILLGAIAALVLFACVTPGKQSFDLGQNMAKQNRLDEAVSFYEDAYSKEPDNQEYAAILKQTKEMLVKKYLDNAKSQLASRPASFDQMKKAQSEIDKALKMMPENDEVKKVASSIKAEMDGLSKQAEMLYSKATAAMDAKDWAAAVKSFRELKNSYPNYLDVSIKLSMSENNMVSDTVSQAEKLKAAEDWEGIVKVLSSLQELQLSGPEMSALMKEAQSRNNAEYYFAKAEESAKQNDWVKVVGLVNRTLAMSPPAAIAKKIAQLRQSAAAFFVNKAQAAIGGNKLYDAYSNMEMAIDIRPELRKDHKNDDVIEQLITAMTAKADAYEANGQIGNAFLWCEKALKLSGNRRALSTKVQGLRDKIRQRVVKKIAIMDFTPPNNNPDAGRVMTDSLLSYLTKNSTGDVKILARDVLGAILKEIEMGQAGLYDIESAKKAGKLKGTDVFIFGSVLNYSIEKNVDEGFKTVNAVVSKKSVPNPEYQSWKSANPNPTDDDLKKAPKMTTEEEVTQMIKYKVATHRKVASVQVSFRVIDVEEGEVVITKTLKNKKEAEDTYSEGVDFANIPYKAVKLPSDTELFDQVVESTVAELGYSVLSRFQNLQVLYSNSAASFKKKGDYEQAIEKYIDAIHVEELKNTSSPVSENARKEIEQLVKSVSF